MKLYKLREFIEGVVVRDMDNDFYGIGGMVNKKIQKILQPLITKTSQRISKLEKIVDADNYEYKTETKLIKKNAK